MIIIGFLSLLMCSNTIYAQQIDQKEEKKIVVIETHKEVDTISGISQNNSRIGVSKFKNKGSRAGKGGGGDSSIRVDLDAPYSTYSAAELVQEVLITGCLTASDVTFSGDEGSQIGFFTKGNATFPLQEGILISTGSVSAAMGPNTGPSETTQLGGGSDAQLESIASGTVYDAAVLEFDFVPSGDTVSFSYVFASEEYPEYSCSNFNDVFGFFVTSLENDGIGYNNENVAQLPNSLGEVSINNVHGDGRSDGSLSYSYDGDFPFENGCASSSEITVFSENFSNGLDDWSFDPSQGNWYIYNNRARFDDYTPGGYLSNYTHAMVSEDIPITSGLTTTLEFDLYLDDYSTTGDEYMFVEVWNGTAWVRVGSYDNSSGNISETYSIDITGQMISNITKLRFIAEGDYSFDIDYWQVDNISIIQSSALQDIASFYSLSTTCTSSNEAYYVDQSAYVYETGTGDCVESVRGMGNAPYTVFENMEADGRTIRMTATFVAVPCSTYHIKIAVGDVGDEQWDSWVFLEGSSFTSNDILLTAYGNGIQNSSDLYEDCTNNQLIVQRVGGDMSQELTAEITYNPSHMNGTDIVQMDGSPLPVEVTLPPGVTSDTIFYYAPDDGIIEPVEAETFTLTFFTGCTCSPEPNAIFLDLSIHDVIDLSDPDIVATNLECSGVTNGVIIINPHGGSGNYEYKLDNGSWQSENTYTGLAQGFYDITVRDSLWELTCQDPITVSDVEISLPQSIDAEAGDDVSLCVGSSAILSGSGGVLYSWSPATWLDDPTSASPVVTPSGLTNTPVSVTYTLTVTDQDGNCTDTDQVMVTAFPKPDVSVYANGTAASSWLGCPDDITTLTAVVSSETTTASSIYLWSSDETSQAIVVSPDFSSSYDVSVENEYGCIGYDNIIMQVYPINVEANITSAIVCPGDNNGSVSVDVSGHFSIYPVVVQINSSNGYSNTLTFTESGQQIIENLNEGEYTVSGTSDYLGCSSTDYLTLAAIDNEDPVINCGSDITTTVQGATSVVLSPDEPQVSDNCTPTQNLVTSFLRSDGNVNLSDPFSLGETSITWTVADEAGNTAQCIQRIYVENESAPGGVNDGLRLWLKANEGVYNDVSLASNGEMVTRWDDYAGNFDALQSTSGIAPVFSNSESASINYNPSVTFDGTDDHMLSDLKTVGLTSQNTLFFVSKPNASGSVIGLGQNSYVGFGNNNLIYSINGNAAVTETVIGSYGFDEIKLVSVVKAGDTEGDISFYINGSLVINSSNGCESINTSESTCIGFYNSLSPGSYFQGAIVEIIVYNNVLSEVQRRAVESYLSTKYGITM